MDISPDISSDLRFVRRRIIALLANVEHHVRGHIERHVICNSEGETVTSIVSNGFHELSVLHGGMRMTIDIVCSCGISYPLDQGDIQAISQAQLQTIMDVFIRDMNRRYTNIGNAMPEPLIPLEQADAARHDFFGDPEKCVVPRPVPEPDLRDYPSSPRGPCDFLDV